MAIDRRELDRRIKFLRAETTTNRLGEEVQGELVLLTEAAARYTPVSDAEKFRAGRVEVSYTARFVVLRSRALMGVTHQDLIEFRGERFEIYGFKEIEGGCYLEFTVGGVDGD